MPKATKSSENWTIFHGNAWMHFSCMKMTLCVDFLNFLTMLTDFQEKLGVLIVFQMCTNNFYCQTLCRMPCCNVFGTIFGHLCICYTMKFPHEFAKLEMPWSAALLWKIWEEGMNCWHLVSHGSTTQMRMHNLHHQIQWDDVCCFCELI